MNGFSFDDVLFFPPPPPSLYRNRAKNRVSIRVYGVSKNGPVYLSGFRADTLVGPGRWKCSIDFDNFTADRPQRPDWLPKIKKKKRKKEEEEKMGKANSAKGTGRKGGHTHEKRKGSYTTSDRLTKKDELTGCKAKTFWLEINVTDTPVRRSINCLTVHRESREKLFDVSRPEIKPWIRFCTARVPCRWNSLPFGISLSSLSL